MKFNLALYDLFNTSIEEGVYDYPKRLSKAILDLKNTYTKLEGVLVLDGSSDLYEQDFRNAHKQKYSDGAYYASLAVDLVRKDVVKQHFRDYIDRVFTFQRSEAHNLFDLMTGAVSSKSSNIHFDDVKLAASIMLDDVFAVVLDFSIEKDRRFYYSITNISKEQWFKKTNIPSVVDKLIDRLNEKEAIDILISNYKFELAKQTSDMNADIDSDLTSTYGTTKRKWYKFWA